jgi:hypothetical protein
MWYEIDLLKSCTNIKFGIELHSIDESYAEKYKN